MKAALRAVKNTVYQFEPIEVKVREATSSDRWGVTDSVMSEIARSTHDYQEYPKLFAMLWKRLTDVEHVMHVQKALMLLEYLLRYGSERLIQDARRRSRDVANLQKYKHYDENNQDDAKEARAKAKTVHDLLTDEAHLAEERAKAQKMRENMKGFGSNDYQYADENVYRDRDYDRDRDRDGDAPRRQSLDDPYAETKQDEQQEEKKEKKKKKKKEGNDAAAGDDDDSPKKEKKKKKEKEKSSDKSGASSLPTAAASSSSSSAAAAADPFGADPFTPNTDPFASSVIPAALSATTSSVSADSGEKQKKKKKKKETSSSSSAPDSAAAAYAAVAAQPSPAAQVDPFAPSTDMNDLSAFAASPKNNHHQQYVTASGDVDILTGKAHTNSLVDMFAHSDPFGAAPDDEDSGSSRDSTPSPPPFTHQLQQQQQQQEQTKEDKKKDLWASDFVNLDRLDQAPPASQQNKKPVTLDGGGVSMSMMKGMNPNANSTPRPTPAPSSSSFSQSPFPAPLQQQPNPAFGASPFAMSGGMAAAPRYNAPPPLGPPMPMAGYPQMGGMPMQPHPYGAMQQPYGGMQQPFPQPMYGGGRPSMIQPGPADPFASIQPNRQAASNPIIFDVPQARR